MKFYIIKQKKEIRLAFPQNNYKLKKLSLSYLKVYNKKAKIWLIFVKILYYFRLLKKENLKNLPVPQIIFQDKKAQKIFENSILIFPKDHTRKKVYAIINKEGKQFFLKIGFDNKSIKELSHEYEFLKKLSKKRFNNFSIPHLLKQNVYNQSIVVNWYECLPPRSKVIIDWSLKTTKIWKELISINLNKQVLENSIWYEKLMSKNSKDYKILTISGQSITFSFIHGDFSPWNILFFRDNSFLIDFEESSWEGPFLVDPLHFELARSFFIYKENENKALSRALNRCNSLYPESDFSIQFLAAIIHELYFANVFPKNYLENIYKLALIKINEL